MKKVCIFVLVLGSVLVSCTKQQVSMDPQTNCMQQTPAWCATVRCSPDGKPVCGCNNVTYGSACAAQCAGVAFTYGACKN